ncbi:hypothetical protein AKG08_21320 [Achromobacter piechaudii]|uniref:hypothetical protein n=1 Tax=Achromobacter piechaudii TaxID=72556 RepID=UPI000680A0B2|nr:hypothetical protein [Achromobacter piechaudii]KNY08565.1 hypothetical protein AKG08_21320 [Achromobacter piechaudii]
MTDFSTLSLRMALDAHTRIEQWIGQPDAPEPLLAALLDDFAPAFTMISVDGQRLPAGALPDLFAGLRGSRPGLKIQIDELAVRHADAASALLTYCERHAWQGGATQRRASALFTAGADGQPRWAHLHETWA